MMVMARKDKKGRNLKTGESQRPDGRYMYRYKDEITGRRISVYDSTLTGLREQEKQIMRDLEDLIITDVAVRKLTINDLFEQYMATKTIRNTTRTDYLYIWNHWVRENIGGLSIFTFKTSHALKFFAELSNQGLKKSTIGNVYRLLNPCFELAVKDGILRRNPVTGTNKNHGKPSEKRKALSAKQQKNLIKFVSTGKYIRYLPIIQIMLGTCMRVGETTGLTWDNVDMDNRLVHVTGQIVYARNVEGVGCEIQESKPKTVCGIRTIPMTNEVYEAFKMQKKINELLKLPTDYVVGNRKDFIFLVGSGRPISRSELNHILRSIVSDYNNAENLLAESQHRTPELMPHISAHILRHTGCTRLGENNVNPKVMQYVMGHANIAVTMNIYNHVTDVDRVADEMAKMDLTTS